MNVNGQTITDSELMAEKFNNYFTGIAQHLSGKISRFNKFIHRAPETLTS